METPSPSAEPPEPAAPEPPRQASPAALSGLFVLAIFYTIYLTRSFLLPVVLALLLMYLLVPAVRLLANLRIPRALGALLVVGLLLGGAGMLISRLVEPASSWIEKAPYSFTLIQQKIRPLKRPVEQVTAATKQIEEITKVPDDPEAPPAVKVEEAGLFETVVRETPGMLAMFVTIVILLYFMLAYEDAFLRGVVRALPSLHDKRRAITIARSINARVSHYLLTVTAINAGLGIVIGLVLAWLGMPNPALWGCMAFILNFIPYVGAVIGVAAITLAAILSFDQLGWSLIHPAAYFAVTAIEGNFVTPTILGRSFTLNPVVLVIGLLFWTWLWGIPGTLLAVPILVTFQIFCTHIEALAPFRAVMER